MCLFKGVSTSQKLLSTFCCWLFRTFFSQYIETSRNSPPQIPQQTKWLGGGPKVGLVLNILLVIREMEITHPASQLCCQLVITGDDIAMPTIPWRNRSSPSSSSSKSLGIFLNCIHFQEPAKLCGYRANIKPWKLWKFFLWNIWSK